jgi:hypothetical protein
MSEAKIRQLQVRPSQQAKSNRSGLPLLDHCQDGALAESLIPSASIHILSQFLSFEKSVRGHEIGAARYRKPGVICCNG